MNPLRSWSQLTGFQRDCIRAIAKLQHSTEASYGLAIKRTLEEWYGTEVNHGRLYPNLDDLGNKGYVEKSELDKRTNAYELTTVGDRLLDASIQRDIELTDEFMETATAPARADGGGDDDM